MKLFHDPEHKKIDWLDERFYQDKEGNFYPSVTTILSIYPKGFGFNEWLKSVGFNAELILQKAQDTGSKIHNKIDEFLNNEEIIWDDKEFNLAEWKMICNFMDFYDGFKPQIITNETELMSKTLGYAGTLDIVCKIKDKVYLIDFKTGNYLWKEHELQISAYAMLWNEAVKDLKDFPPIDDTAILHLRANTKGRDKREKVIQGDGWALKTYDRPYTEAFKIFQHIHEIYKEENPDAKPRNLTLPDRFVRT